MLFPTLGPSSLPIVVAPHDKRHANRTTSVLEWYDRHKALCNTWLKQEKLTIGFFVNSWQKKLSILLELVQCLNTSFIYLLE